MHDFVLAPEGSFFIQRALSLPIMGFRSWNLNLMLTTIMSSYGINFVKKYLLVWLPFLLTFQISCVHRILKHVLYGKIQPKTAFFSCGCHKNTWLWESITPSMFVQMTKGQQFLNPWRKGREKMSSYPKNSARKRVQEGLKFP